MFVIGADGLADEVRAAGFEVVRYGDGTGVVPTIGACSGSAGERGRGVTRRGASADSEAAFASAEVAEGIGAVVCGWDTSLCFTHLSYAALVLHRNPRAVFVATNTDAFDMLPNGPIPGNGAAVAALATACGRGPVVAGKPSDWLHQLVAARLDGVPPERTCMVGDRLDTDVAFGHLCGFGTAMTLTGCSTEEEARSAGAGAPLYVLPSVAALLPGLARA